MLALTSGASRRVIALLCLLVCAGCASDGKQVGLELTGHGHATRGSVYQMVAEKARAKGVPVSLALAVTRQESGGNCRAHSWADARGVMQVLPSTARKDGFDPKRLYECEYGAEAGLTELKKLIDQYGVNCWSLSLYGGSAHFASACRHRGTPYASAVMAGIRRFARSGERTIAAVLHKVSPFRSHHHRHHWIRRKA